MLTKTDNLTIDVMLVEKLIHDSKLQGVIEAWNRIFKEYVAEALKPSHNGAMVPCSQFKIDDWCHADGDAMCGDKPCMLLARRM